MMLIISVGLRPHLSAMAPKIKAPSGRKTKVRNTASATLETSTWNSAAIGLMQKMSRKKSSESSDQPRKEARKAWRCERVRLRKLAPIVEKEPRDIRRSIADGSTWEEFERWQNICCNNYLIRAS